MFKPSRDGLDLLNPGRFDELVYERERLYRFNGAVLAVWWEVLAEGDLFGRQIGYIEMSKEESIQIKRLADLENLQAQLDRESAQPSAVAAVEMNEASDIDRPAATRFPQAV